MMIEGHCRDCNEWFDAHWSKYPNDLIGIFNPYCLKCGSKNVRITTDEDNDYPIEYEEVDENE